MRPDDGTMKRLRSRQRRKEGEVNDSMASNDRRSSSERMEGLDGQQRMTERLMTVKTTAMRSRSERLNASRNKHAGEETKKKQKLLFQC